MMSEHGQDFDGMRNFLEKYLFISDDTIELQMFQGCQNWSWISQGVLGSNFIALPGNQGAWAIQLQLIPVPGWSTRNFNSCREDK